MWLSSDRPFDMILCREERKRYPDRETRRKGDDQVGRWPLARTLAQPESKQIIILKSNFFCIGTINNDKQGRRYAHTLAQLESEQMISFMSTFNNDEMAACSHSQKKQVFLSEESDAKLTWFKF